MLCVNGIPIFPQEHFDRLINHAKIMGITPTLTFENFKNAAQKILQQNNHTTGHIVLNTLITRGETKHGLKTPPDQSPNIIMRTSPITPNNTPITAIIAKSTCRNERSPLSQIKSINYGDNILATQEAETANADDAIMLNTQGNAACFTIGNLVILKNNQLITPPLTDGAMDGIIRQKWINKSNILERSITTQDIETADAIFRTNAIRGITPITAINGKTLPPPPITIDKDIHLN